MVYLVVLRGPNVAVSATREQLRRAATGFFPLNDTTFLMGQSAGTEALRNFINRHPDIQVAVMELSGAWASGGLPELTQWLRNAEGIFYS